MRSERPIIRRFLKSRGVHKELGVFAHEPAKPGMIGTGAVFIEAERGSVLSPGEQEAITDDRSFSRVPSYVVDRWCAENVVSVSLENGAVGLSKKCHAALVILLVIEGPETGVLHCAIPTLQNFINPFPIQIPSPDVAKYAILKNRPFAFINIILTYPVNYAFYASTQSIEGEFVTVGAGAGRNQM